MFRPDNGGGTVKLKVKDGSGRNRAPGVDQDPGTKWLEKKKAEVKRSRGETGWSPPVLTDEQKQKAADQARKREPGSQERLDEMKRKLDEAQGANRSHSMLASLQPAEDRMPNTRRWGREEDDFRGVADEAGKSGGHDRPLSRQTWDWPGHQVPDMSPDYQGGPWDYHPNFSPLNGLHQMLAEASRPSTWAEREPNGGPGMRPGETPADWIRRNAGKPVEDPNPYSNPWDDTSHVGDYGFWDRVANSLHGVNMAPVAGGIAGGVAMGVNSLMDLLPALI